MINSHLHIWDSVWSDEFNKMKESEIKTTAVSNTSTTIMVDNKSKKRGKK